MHLMLSKPVRRFAALALLLLAVIAAHGLIVRPFAQSWVGTVGAIEDARALGAGYARTAAARPSYEEQAAALRAEAPNPEWFIQGETDALAAATLQDRVSSMAVAAGAEVRSIQTIPAADENGMRRVGVTVELAARTQALLRAAYAIESGTPFLFITSAEAISDSVNAPSDDPMLTVRLEVAAYRLPDSTAAAAQ